jgi:hypothetical protein
MQTRPLNVRQGVIGGAIVSIIAASGAAGRSADPLPTFAGILVVALVATALATLGAVAINRHSGPPIRW